LYSILFGYGSSGTWQDLTAIVFGMSYNLEYEAPMDFWFRDLSQSSQISPPAWRTDFSRDDISREDLIGLRDDRYRVQWFRSGRKDITSTDRYLQLVADGHIDEQEYPWGRFCSNRRVAKTRGVISRSPSTESSIVDLEEVQHKKKLEFAVQSRGKGTRKWINRVRAERSTRTSLPRSRSPLRPPAPGLVPTPASPVLPSPALVPVLPLSLLLHEIIDTPYGRVRRPCINGCRPRFMSCPRCRVGRGIGWLM
jgi:hypothetical protein